MNGERNVVPKVTAALLIGAAVASFFPSPWGDALLHRTNDLATGKWWTLWTAHLVHFSRSHFLWDALALAVLGGWFERRAGSRTMFCLMLVSAPLIVLGTMHLESSLAGYGGFSGLACALAGAATVECWARGGKSRRFCWLLGGSICAKIAWELAHPGAALFVDTGSVAVRPVAWAHAVGAVVGTASAVTLNHTTNREQKNLGRDRPPEALGRDSEESGDVPTTVSHWRLRA